jgi:hypothetical protein
MIANSDCDLGEGSGAVGMYVGLAVWIVEREDPRDALADAELWSDAEPGTDTGLRRLDGSGGGKIRMVGAIDIVFPIGKGIWMCVCYDKGSAILGLAGSRILEMAL